MEHATVNCFGKIWLFWDKEWEWNIITDTIQQIRIIFTHQMTYQQALITTIYARCSAVERLELWEDLERIAEGSSIPWVVGGDFNIILNDEEKLGGLSVSQVETTNFAQCISNCDLTEFPFSESLYTW